MASQRLIHHVGWAMDGRHLRHVRRGLGDRLLSVVPRQSGRASRDQRGRAPADRQTRRRDGRCDSLEGPRSDPLETGRGLDQHLAAQHPHRPVVGDVRAALGLVSEIPPTGSAGASRTRTSRATWPAWCWAPGPAPRSSVAGSPTGWYVGRATIDGAGRPRPSRATGSPRSGSRSASGPIRPAWRRSASPSRFSASSSRHPRGVVLQTQIMQPARRRALRLDEHVRAPVKADRPPTPRSGAFTDWREATWLLRPCRVGSRVLRLRGRRTGRVQVLSEPRRSACKES